MPRMHSRAARTVKTTVRCNPNCNDDALARLKYINTLSMRQANTIRRRRQDGANSLAGRGSTSFAEQRADVSIAAGEGDSLGACPKSPQSHRATVERKSYSKAPAMRADRETTDSLNDRTDLGVEPGKNQPVGQSRGEGQRFSLRASASLPEETPYFHHRCHQPSNAGSDPDRSR